METLEAIPYARETLLWLASYLIGSVSCGYLLLRATGHGDIRARGSKGTGATNALRIAGKGIGAAVLIGDFLKGFLPVWLVYLYWGEAYALLAGSGIFIGHLFPCWLSFRGGKAIASLIGIVFVLDWRIAALFCICWVLVALLTRYSSLASLLAALSLPLSALLFQQSSLILPGIIAALFIVFAHRNNIRRLLNGSENKLGDTVDR